MFSFPSKKSTEESAGTAGSAGRTLPTQTLLFRVIIPALFFALLCRGIFVSSSDPSGTIGAQNIRNVSTNGECMYVYKDAWKIKATILLATCSNACAAATRAPPP